ncbi:MAG: hypothetical protein NT167_27690 [Verrucomicrobia bacterium]|nr:hypothetical protein [Verrucomicrobiota bacterium]
METAAVIHEGECQIVLLPKDLHISMTVVDVPVRAEPAHREGHTPSLKWVEKLSRGAAT